MIAIAKKKPTPTISRECTIEPLTAQSAFPEDFKGSREEREQRFIFGKIMDIIMNSHNRTFSISDVFGVASTLPISLSAVRGFYEDWCQRMVKSKRIEAIPSIDFDSVLYKVIG